MHFLPPSLRPAHSRKPPARLRTWPTGSVGRRPSSRLDERRERRLGRLGRRAGALGGAELTPGRGSKFVGGPGLGKPQVFFALWAAIFSKGGGRFGAFV